MSEMKPVMDAAYIQRILPHRYPFLLIDRLDEVVEGPKAPNRTGRRVRATKCVTINEPFFQGHFPGRPVMPGVLLVEAMAQAGALGCAVDGRDIEVALVGIKNAKFRRAVVPGDQLTITGEVLRDGGQMLSVELKCHVGEELVAETEILARVIIHPPKEGK